MTFILTALMYELNSGRTVIEIWKTVMVLVCGACGQQLFALTDADGHGDVLS